MQELLSLEQKLTSQWETARAEAVETIAQAEYNLGRITMIYNGQMSLPFEEAE